MSQTPAVYAVDKSLPQSLCAFTQLNCCKAYSTGLYVPPTPEEIAQLIKLARWSQNDVAKLVGVSYNKKGSTTVRKWKTAMENVESRTIPYSTWRLLLACAGVINVDDDVSSLRQS